MGIVAKKLLLTKFTQRIRKWSALLLHFLAGQATVQIISVLTGFFLLRWLSVTAYAQYSVAFGYQSTLGMLIDLSFANSIIALVGNQGDNKEIIGTYIRSARLIRNRLLFAVIGVSCFLFPVITFRQHWGAAAKASLLLAISTYLLFQTMSLYSAPLLIGGKIRQYYRPQIVGTSSRFVLNFCLHILGYLNAITTTWLTSVMAGICGLLYHREAKHLISEPSHVDPQATRQLLRFSGPLIPAIVFTAFQSQISVMIITIYGQTKSIAEVGALGRVSQIFVILSAFSSVVVGPYIAKVAHNQLRRRYLQIVFAATLLSILISATAFKYPQLLLWLLGPKYHALGRLTSWMVLGCSINFVSYLLWIMNSSRKWRYWWYSTLEIVLAVMIQILYVTRMDMSLTRNVVFMSIATFTAIAITHVIGAIYGYTRDSRSATSNFPSAPNEDLTLVTAELAVSANS